MQHANPHQYLRSHQKPKNASGGSTLPFPFPIPPIAITISTNKSLLPPPFKPSPMQHCLRFGSLTLFAQPWRPIACRAAIHVFGARAPIACHWYCVRGSILLGGGQSRVWPEAWVCAMAAFFFREGGGWGLGDETNRGDSKRTGMVCESDSGRSYDRISRLIRMAMCGIVIICLALSICLHIFVKTSYYCCCCCCVQTSIPAFFRKHASQGRRQGACCKL